MEGSRCAGDGEGKPNIGWCHKVCGLPTVAHVPGWKSELLCLIEIRIYNTSFVCREDVSRQEYIHHYTIDVYNCCCLTWEGVRTRSSEIGPRWPRPSQRSCCAVDIIIRCCLGHWYLLFRDSEIPVRGVEDVTKLTPSTLMASKHKISTPALVQSWGFVILCI